MASAPSGKRLPERKVLKVKAGVNLTRRKALLQSGLAMEFAINRPQG